MTDAQRAEARRNALALRIWRHCAPIEWNCTVLECAEAIGEPWRRVAKLAHVKGWSTRFRASLGSGNKFCDPVNSARAVVAPYRLTSANDRETYDW